MFVFFSRCIIGLMIFVSPFTLLSAAGYVKYTPAPQISLSGSSSDARFDVAQVLYDSLSPISAPKLDTTTRTFSGAFYLSGAGWVLMNTGSYSTKLDCGAQYLSGLTSNCTLSGYAWSETIGDIVFDRRVQYIPTTGTLSGKISTYIGDISLDGVMLPLLPATLSGSTYTSMADHHTYIEVKNPQLYESSGGDWEIRTQLPGSSHIYVGGVFYIDFSMATSHIFTITDPNKSTTEYTYDVSSAVPATILDATLLTTDRYKYCSLRPGNYLCQDGAMQSPTTFIHTVNGLGSTSTIADAASHIDVALKLRDRYGNALKTGNVEIIYHTPIQLVDPMIGSSYFSLMMQPTQSGPSILGDAMIHLGPVFNNANLFPDADPESGLILMSGQDLIYSFASYAPGTITLKSLKYNGIDAGIAAPPLTMTPWYTLTDLHSSDIRIGSGVTLTGTLTNNSSRVDTTPMLIHGLSIGENMYATLTDLHTPSGGVCQANQTTMNYTNQCDLSSMGGKIFPSILALNLPTTTSDYTFSGMYTPLISLPYVPPEAITVASAISYTLDGRTILYPTTSQNLGSSNYQNLRIRILGEVHENGWYTGMKSDPQVKVDFFNALRRSIAILTRNRNDYSQAIFSHTGGDIHIGNSDFTTKRSIITEGGDIMIDGNIDLQSGTLAIIAMRDPLTGLGGNIIIHTGVTDIHATLIAEQAVHTSGSGQLYIHGSLMSNNTLGGASRTPLECPYFDNTVCTPSRAQSYDLEYWRSDYLRLVNKLGYTALSPTALRYTDTALIIEYDSRIISDPPPTLSR